MFLGSVLSFLDFIANLTADMNNRGLPPHPPYLFADVTDHLQAVSKSDEMQEKWHGFTPVSFTLVVQCGLHSLVNLNSDRLSVSQLTGREVFLKLVCKCNMAFIESF